eukprot:TRINITY_DN2425_c0_g2_i1.p1 TRINITY_DN2425_c0_g2~~TRINITY_DN2425_c0_g2_i1.p1  ORF type:complete len:575 (+),score=109.85 TRINITY_DN2425_c0_g2_i1:176-1900(+)
MKDDTFENTQLNLKNLIIGSGLGRNSSTSMYEAMNFATRERFALKMINCASDVEFEDALNDVRSFCDTSHPFFVSNYGYVTKEFRLGGDNIRRTWIVYALMEMKQRSLDELIQDNIPGARRRILQQADMPKLVFSTVVALAHLQRRGRTAHGTIKPANVIQSFDGVYQLSNVGTYSFPRLFQRYERERSTPDIRFWSPEALRSAREGQFLRYDVYKSDIYSLGLTLLQAAAPFEIPRLNDPRNTELRNDIEQNIVMVEGNYGRSFGSLLRRMLQLDTKLRPDAASLAFSPDFLDFTRTKMQDVTAYVNQDGPKTRRRVFVNHDEGGVVTLPLNANGVGTRTNFQTRKYPYGDETSTLIDVDYSAGGRGRYGDDYGTQGGQRQRSSNAIRTGYESPDRYGTVERRYQRDVSPARVTGRNETFYENSPYARERRTERVFTRREVGDTSPQQVQNTAAFARGEQPRVLTANRAQAGEQQARTRQATETTFIDLNDGNQRAGRTRELGKERQTFENSTTTETVKTTTMSQQLNVGPTSTTRVEYAFSDPPIAQPAPRQGGATTFTTTTTTQGAQQGFR